MNLESVLQSLMERPQRVKRNKGDFFKRMAELTGMHYKSQRDSIYLEKI